MLTSSSFCMLESFYFPLEPILCFTYTNQPWPFWGQLYIISLNVSKLMTRISKFQSQMLGRQNPIHSAWVRCLQLTQLAVGSLCVDVMWFDAHSIGIVGEEVDKQANWVTHLLYLFSSLGKDSKRFFLSLAQFLQTKWNWSDWQVSQTKW